ncbi:MAG: hypothetical protein LBQ43_04800 [Holosporales bacterium]|jgi:hypothetical protein|nr:hypothetical protein [Holosporales bacterium]
MALVPRVFGIVVFLVYFIFNLKIEGPMYLSDEIGYLSKAAAIAGYPTDMATGWYAGYSFLIAPLFRIFSDPFVIWKGILLVNAAMWGISFTILFYVLAYVFPEKSVKSILPKILVCAIYPGFITFSGYALSTTAFVFFFMLGVWTLIKCLECADFRWHFLNAFLVGYTSWIHPAGLCVAASYYVTLLYGRKRKFNYYVIQILIVCFMVLFYVRVVHPWICITMDPTIDPHATGYGNPLEFLSWLLEIRAFLNFSLHYLGNLTYFNVATFGIFNLFFIKAYLEFKKRNTYSNVYLIFIFIGLSFLAAISLTGIIASKALSPNALYFNWLFNGRYGEMVLFPVLGISVASFDFNKIPQRLVFLSLFISSLFVFILKVSFVEIYGNINDINLVSYWPIALFGFGWANRYYYVWTLGGLFISLIAVLLRKKSFFIMMLVFIVCISFQNKHHVYYVKNFDRPEFMNFIRETFPIGTTIGFDTEAYYASGTFERYPLYAYYLYDYDYKRMNYAEWKNLNCDGIYFTFAPEQIEKNGDDFIMGIDPQFRLFLVVRKNTSFDLFKFKPRGKRVSEAIFAKSFEENNRMTLDHVFFARNLPTVVGNKKSDSLFSTGRAGYLVFGPYIRLVAGKYKLTVNGHAYKLDEAYVDIVSSQGGRTWFVFPLNDSTTTSDMLLQEVFDLSEDDKDYEFRIFVGESDDIRFDSFIVEPYD